MATIGQVCDKEGAGNSMGQGLISVLSSLHFRGCHVITRSIPGLNLPANDGILHGKPHCPQYDRRYLAHCQNDPLLGLNTLAVRHIPKGSVVIPGMSDPHPPLSCASRQIPLAEGRILPKSGAVVALVRLRRGPHLSEKGNRTLYMFVL